jgi:hypothetical protein
MEATHHAQRSSSTLRRTPVVTRAALVALAIIASLIGACGPSTPPTPTGAAGSSGGTSSGASGSASSNASGSASTPDIAATARGVGNRIRSTVEGIETNQNQAVGLANEVMGGPRVTVNALSWPTPEGWTKVPPRNDMRAAELRATTSAGDVEVYWFAFRPTPTGTSSGGDAQANVQRWARLVLDANTAPAQGQPAPYASETRTIAGLRVTSFDSIGTVMTGAPGGQQTPMSNWRMIAVYIEHDRGNVAIRAQGPAEAVAAIEASWRQLVEGMQVR